jgi:hypothetical protein
VLNNDSDLSAWLAERKKRFPTQANIEAKKALAAVENQKRQEHRERNKQQRAAQHAAKVAKSEERKAQAKAKSKPVKSEPEEAIVKTEAIPDDPTLRIAYLEEQLRLAKEAAARPTPIPASPPSTEDVKLEQQDEAAKKERDDGNGTLHVKFEPLDTPTKPDLGLSYNSGDHESAASSSMSDSSSDVSSDPSDDDSDAAPEEESSKTHEPLKVAPPKRSNPSERKRKAPLCANFRKTGNCRFGRRCKYSHELPTRANGKRDQITTMEPRKSLYEKVNLRSSFSSCRNIHANSLISWLSRSCEKKLNLASRPLSTWDRQASSTECRPYGPLSRQIF